MTLLADTFKVPLVQEIRSNFKPITFSVDSLEIISREVSHKLVLSHKTADVSVLNFSSILAATV